MSTAAAVLVAAVLTAPAPVDSWVYRTRCLEDPVCEIIEQPAPMPHRAPTVPPLPPVTAPSPPAPSTTVQAVAPIGGVERWRSLVTAYFPAGEIDTALRVMACESGGNPDAYNPSGATGLMQVMGWWAPEYGYQPADLFDPGVNIEVAAAIWAVYGWEAWSCA